MTSEVGEDGCDAVAMGTTAAAAAAATGI